MAAPIKAGPAGPTARRSGTAALCLAALALALSGCATGPGGAMPGAAAATAGGEDLTRNSAECEAARLQPPAPMPVADLPDSVLKSRQSGWSTVRYDVVNGRPQNLRVVSSSPPGLYDPYALQHARRYSDPGGGSARGCIMTVNIRYY